MSYTTALDCHPIEKIPVIEIPVLIEIFYSLLLLSCRCSWRILFLHNEAVKKLFLVIHHHIPV